MKISPEGVVYLAAGAAGLFVAWRFTQALSSGAGVAADAAAAVKDATVQVVTKDLNPASSDNVVNRGVSAVGAAVTGDDSWSLGGWLASVTGADQDAKVKAMLQGNTRAAQDRYQKPPVSSGQAAESPAPISFLTGATFKDLSQGQDLNPFSAPFAYGGGLSFR